MKIMKKLVLELLICALMSAPAVATINITSDDGLYWTEQAWSFTTQPLSWTGIEADLGWVNTALPTADVALSGFIPTPGWFEKGDESGHTGIIFGNAATIDLHIPNIIDPRLDKIIQVEVTYHVGEYVEGVHGYIDASSYVAAGSDPHYDSFAVNDIALPDGWRDVTIEWHIPQIYNSETIHLYFVNSGIAIDRIEVATVCVPEPATLLLLGGAGLIGWLRRRRA